MPKSRDQTYLTYGFIHPMESRRLHALQNEHFKKHQRERSASFPDTEALWDAVLTITG